MIVERYQNGASIPVYTSVLVNATGAALTGLVDVTVRIRRDTDGFWLDWADSTFKAAGWTTLDGAMTEVDATRAAGVYRRTFPTAGYPDDSYYLRMSSPSASNSPQEAAAVVGDYVDNIDAAISSRGTLANQVTILAGLVTINADTDDIQTRLLDLAALLHENAVVDNTVHTGDGTTTARLRGFATPAAAALAADGAADGAQGETRRWTVTTTYDGVGQVATHRLVRTL